MKTLITALVVLFTAILLPLTAQPFTSANNPSGGDGSPSTKICDTSNCIDVLNSFITTSPLNTYQIDNIDLDLQSGHIGLNGPVTVTYAGLIPSNSNCELHLYEISYRLCVNTSLICKNATEQWVSIGGQLSLTMNGNCLQTELGSEYFDFNCIEYFSTCMSNPVSAEVCCGHPIDEQDGPTHVNIVEDRSRVTNPILVYPSPFSDFIYLENLLASDQIKIYSSDGKLVKNIAVKSNNFKRLDTSQFEPGFYILKLIRENSILEAYKLLKQ